MKITEYRILLCCSILDGGGGALKRLHSCCLLMPCVKRSTTAISAAVEDNCVRCVCSSFLSAAVWSRFSHPHSYNKIKEADLTLVNQSDIFLIIFTDLSLWMEQRDMSKSHLESLKQQRSQYLCGEVADSDCQVFTF